MILKSRRRHRVRRHSEFTHLRRSYCDCECLTKAPPLRITPKKFVLAMIPLLRTELCDVNGSNGLRQDVLHSVFRCPKGDLCTANVNGVKGEYKCQASYGYTNPCRHLLTCYAGSNEEYLKSEYTKKLASSQHDVDRYLVRKREPNTKEEAMHTYIQFIVDNCYPLAVVEKPSFRKINRFYTVVSRKTIRELIFKLVEVVERKLAAEMSLCKGAILHDEWTDKTSTRFVGVFGIYIRRHRNLGSNSSVVLDEILAPFLSCSPMPIASI